jgi:hypothetical protein
VAIDWEAISKEKELEKKAEFIRRDNRAREISLHAFLQLLCLSYIYLHKPDEEA